MLRHSFDPGLQMRTTVPLESGKPGCAALQGARAGMRANFLPPLTVLVFAGISACFTEKDIHAATPGWG